MVHAMSVCTAVSIAACGGVGRDGLCAAESRGCREAQGEEWGRKMGERACSNAIRRTTLRDHACATPSGSTPSRGKCVAEGGHGRFCVLRPFSSFDFARRKQFASRVWPSRLSIESVAAMLACKRVKRWEAQSGGEEGDRGRGGWKCVQRWARRNVTDSAHALSPKHQQKARHANTQPSDS